MKHVKFSLHDIEDREVKYRLSFLLAHPELRDDYPREYDYTLAKYQKEFDEEERRNSFNGGEGI